MTADYIPPHSARWDPQARHDMAILRIERAVEKAVADSRVSFTPDDVEYVALLMGFELPPSALARPHTDDTQRSASNGETSTRPSVRKPIDPNKTYRLRSTGERITGAELLRRRAES